MGSKAVVDTVLFSRVVALKRHDIPVDRHAKWIVEADALGTLEYRHCLLDSASKDRTVIGSTPQRVQLSNF